MHTLVSSLSLTYSVPVKSTPVTVNGGASMALTLGNGGGLETRMAFL